MGNPAQGAPGKINQLTTNRTMEVGWVCPKCGEVNSPTNESCKNRCVVTIKNGNRKNPNIIERR